MTDPRPTKWAIVQYWASTPDDAGRNIFAPHFSLDEPCCFTCGWFSERWKGGRSIKKAWERARLERAHITPAGVGGSDEADNIILMCTPCHSEEKRRRGMKSKYGISVEQYEMMLQAQGGVCAICKKPPPQGERRMGVDHCHESGRVRGILCHGCNRWLGVYEKFRKGVDKYDSFLAKYGNGNPLLEYDTE
ncbi:endonuclease domain-containing protein [Streptomyces mirabilis]|uniref:endonuclease VII domain-containing protein n=1 Tax=Streptomyces mirabilis TaxID=68239 RepID=UPI0033ABE9E8